MFALKLSRHRSSKTETDQSDPFDTTFLPRSATCVPRHELIATDADLECAPVAHSIGTANFEVVAVEGGTLLTSCMRHGSFEARDMHVANGMESGMTEAYERLDELLAAEQSA